MIVLSMSPRGGKRPGAGAPKGNKNALKKDGSKIRYNTIYNESSIENTTKNTSYNATPEKTTKGDA